MSLGQSVLFLVLIVFSYSLYLGYLNFSDFAHGENVERCVENVSSVSTPFFKGDPEHICSCQMEEVRGDFFFDKESPEFKKRFAERLGVCIEDYVDRHGENSCELLASSSENSDFFRKISKMVDCSCFIKEMIPYFVSNFTEGEKFDMSNSQVFMILSRCEKNDGRSK